MFPCSTWLVFTIQLFYVAIMSQCGSTEEVVVDDVLGACHDQPCVHGLCVPMPEDQYRCYCRNGYTGLNCQTNYDDCRNEPCRNNASCIDGEDFFTCVCVEGFTGELCETELNECISNPCMNDGICEDLLNSYMCHCPLAYEGVNCERYFNACEPMYGKDICQNGGLCMLLTGNAFSCSCQEGFYGEFCELIDCPCLRGGICVGESMKSCLCPFGWTGKDCETKVDFCDESICSNRGVCIYDVEIGNDSYGNESFSNTTCFCVPDYHGRFCESQYDECMPYTPCSTNASCVDGIDGFSCKCVNGLKGIYCNITEVCEKSICPTPSIQDYPDLTAVDRMTSPSPSSHKSIPGTIEIIEFSSTQPPLLSATHSDLALSDDRQLSLSYEESVDTLDYYSFMSISSSHNGLIEIYPTNSAVPFQSSKFVLSSTVIHPSKESTGTFSLDEISPQPNATVPVSRSVPSSEHTQTQSSVTDQIEVNRTDLHHNFCHEKKCQNGGSAILKLTRKGNDHHYECECLCKLLYTGPECEDQVFILIPQFHGHSYILHSFLSADEELGRDLDIHVAFRARSARGMIFFVDSGESDAFLLLYVEDGMLKLRFSCGHQVMLFMENHVSIYDRYVSVTVTVSWTAVVSATSQSTCSVGLLVNGSSPMRGEHFVYGRTTPRFSRMYIGGLPANFKKDNPWLRTMSYLNGCVISLEVNGIERDLLRESEDGAYITECFSSACFRNPCLNGAKCENFQDHWICICPSEFSGPLCQYRTCRTNPCLSGGTCLSDLHHGYICLCPYGKSGRNCETEADIRYAMFHGSFYGYSSYVAYHQWFYGYHMEIRVAFTASDLHQRSLLLFHAREGRHAQEFAAVVLESGFVSYLFDFGSAVRILKSVQVIQPGSPVHRLVIGKHQRYSWLELDSQPKIMGVASDQYSTAGHSATLYVGGHLSFNSSGLPKELKHYDGFKGCILDVQVRNSPNGIFRSASNNDLISGRNIRQCDISECALIKCHNGGTCENVDDSDFRCRCRKGFVGRLCEEMETPCSTGNHKCSSNSKCIPLGLDYKCDCKFGFIGRLCNESVTIHLPSFNGIDSYLSLPSGNIKYTTDIQLSIWPLSDSGLVFHSAQRFDGATSHDFVSVFLSNGRLHCIFNLGYKSALNTRLVSNTRIEQRKWHVVRFGRYKRAAYLKVNNDSEITAVSPAGWETLDTDSRLLFGGLPDFSFILEGALVGGVSYFNGCISIMKINADIISLNKNEKVTSRNVMPCDQDFCSHELCTDDRRCRNGEACSCGNDLGNQDCKYPIQKPQLECRNGGTIVVTGNDGPRCDCPVGWSGHSCDRVSDIKFSMWFYGNGCLEHSDDLGNVIDTDISFSYSTELSSAFIFSTSEGYSEDGDYLMVGINNNKLHVVWSLGWLSTNEIFTTELDHRKDIYHTVRINRLQRELILHVDNFTLSGHVEGQFVEMNTENTYSFGGFCSSKSIEAKTGGFFSDAFVGCIKDIALSGHKVDIRDSQGGRNIDVCF